MKRLGQVYEALLYIAVFGSAWVFTARELGAALVHEVRDQPASVNTLITAIALGSVLLGVALTRYLGPVRASAGELLIYDGSRGASTQVAVAAVAGGGIALVLGTLVLWMGAALPPTGILARVAALIALICALLVPLAAARWQRRGAELIPRWRLLAANSRTEALSTTVLTLDSSAMTAVADIEKNTGRKLRAGRIREIAHEHNAIALHLAGPEARRRQPSHAPRRASLFRTGLRRAARSHAVLMLIVALTPSAVAALGSANLALGAAVVLASLVGTALSRALGELASLHRLRRQWALRTPPPTVQVGGGLVLLGGGTALCAVGGAVGVLSLMGVELPALSVLVAWLVVAVGAAVSGIVGAAVNALKSMKADIRIITSPEFGPIPVYLIERIISGRIGPVIALLVLLNGFALGAIIVALFFVGNGIFDLREEIRGADFSDTHVIKRGTKA